MQEEKDLLNHYNELEHTRNFEKINLKSDDGLSKFR